MPNKIKHSNANSMTGYGKATFSKNNLTIEIEVKTLNNRHLDINSKLPRDYSEHEMKLREAVQKFFKRGRVDIQVNRSLKAKAAPQLKFNLALYEKLTKLFRDQAKKLKIYEEEFAQEALIEILSRKDVLEVVEEIPVKPAQEKELLFKLLNQACSKVQQSRRIEGARLVKDIKVRTNMLLKNAAGIKKFSIIGAGKARANLLSKIKNMKVESLEPGRLEQEVALLLLRSDITEELVRLESHLKTLANNTSSIDGKKLDFMLQEILREFNTIGSKSADVDITGLVVDAKTEIERIREQSQNLE
jgi:uncharacterized protein (TIGR00255 family)